jgi:tetrahydromethanopterin S-methyltransferase subunit F
MPQMSRKRIRLVFGLNSNRIASVAVSAETAAILTPNLVFCK